MIINKSKPVDVVTLILRNIKAKAKGLGGQFDVDIKEIHMEEIHNRMTITIGG